MYFAFCEILLNVLQLAVICIAWWHIYVTYLSDNYASMNAIISTCLNIWVHKTSLI